MGFHVYRGFRILCLPEEIPLQFLLDGPKHHRKFEMTVQVRASKTHLPVNINRQRNDCARNELVLTSKITVPSTQPIPRSGEGEH